MMSTGNTPLSEAEVLRLFNQFLQQQQGGTGIDMSKLNIELKISKKDNDESVGVLTVDLKPAPKPEVQIKMEVKEEKERNPQVCLERNSGAVASMDHAGEKITNPQTAKLEGHDRVSDRMAEKVEDHENHSFRLADLQTDHGNLQGTGARGGDIQLQAAMVPANKSSVHALASDVDGKSSLSNFVVDPMAADRQDKATRPHLISAKMEEMYLRELQHFNSVYGPSTFVRKKSRSVRMSESPRRLKKRPVLFVGQSMSAKSLKEYIEAKEKLMKAENREYFNLFGEKVRLPQLKTAIKESLPKYKSMVPTGCATKEILSPIENEDEKLRKHFGEVSLLSAGDPNSQPQHPKVVEKKENSDHPETSPPSFPSPKEKFVTSPLDCFERVDVEESGKKKTKISHLMQQMEGEGAEDDGGELLGLLEAAKSTEDAWKEKQDDCSDLAKLEALMSLEVGFLNEDSSSV
jgi:hypothetical protein